MQFTPKEMKLIVRLRKQELKWPRRRWMLLVTALFVYAVYACISYWIFSNLDSDKFSKDDAILLFALYWPKCILGVAIGSWLMVLAIRDWNGNANRMLLLKLLEEQEKKTDSP